MRLLQVTYGTNKNLGNYESEKMELVAAVEEHENPDKVINLLKVAVAEYLGKQPQAEQIISVLGGGMVLTEDGKETDPSTGEKVEKKTKKVSKKTTKKTKKTAKKVAKDATDNSREDVSTSKVGGENDIPSDEVPPVIEYTADQVKEGLVAVWKKKGKAVAQDILASFEVTKSSELTEEQYEAVMVEVEKCLK